MQHTASPLSHPCDHGSLRSPSSRSARALLARCHARVLWHEEHGQATTEYALVMLGAALVALLVVGWATSGGAGGKIGRLFDKVVDAVIDKL